MNKLNAQQQGEKDLLEKELDKEHAVLFKKRELILIFNMLVTAPMKFGDFVVVEPIIKKIEPVVAVASNIPEKPTLIGVNN